MSRSFFGNFGGNNQNHSNCNHDYNHGHGHRYGNGNGNGYQMQQQQLVSKQSQVEATVNAQIVLEMTQKCIKNIRKLGNLYMAEAQADAQAQKMQGKSHGQQIDSDEKHNNINGNRNGNRNGNGNDEEDIKSQIFIQQMITGQLLNTLRMAMSDDNISNNSNANKLSMLELGKFKQELLNANVPKSLIDKILPFVETMQVTLQDYKQSFHVPGPKLNPTTFNQETVSNGMELFLGSQHKISDRKKDIKNNAQEIGKHHNDALNNQSNKQLVNNMKNEKIDSSKVSVDSLFGNIDKTYLDFGNTKNEDDDLEITNKLHYGENWKEEVCKETEQAAAQARSQRDRRRKHRHPK